MIDGIRKHNYGNFWEINQSLCDKPITDLKKYAVRIFSNVHHTYVQPNIEVNKQAGSSAASNISEGGAEGGGSS
jgi:hypothetical protein